MDAMAILLRGAPTTTDSTSHTSQSTATHDRRLGDRWLAPSGTTHTVYTHASSPPPNTPYSHSTLRSLVHGILMFWFLFPTRAVFFIIYELFFALFGFCLFSIAHRSPSHRPAPPHPNPTDAPTVRPPHIFCLRLFCLLCLVFFLDFFILGLSFFVVIVLFRFYALCSNFQ